MPSTQNLIDELARDYTQSKYSGKYLKEKIKKILEFILPHIKFVVENEKEKEPVKLWNIIKEDEKIKTLFREIIEKIDRPIVIYVASKFENNKYFGTIIIKETLK